MAKLLSTLIDGFVKSKDFVSGALGSGWRIAKQFGRWVLEIDDIVVRGRMTVFELLIQKIRAVKGALGITQGSGKIKEIREDMDNYYLQIEDEMSFVSNDIVRCQTFSSGTKNYWVIVSKVENNEVVIPKSEFLGSSLPEVGDEMIQFGNTTDETRQSAIYLHADEGGQPAIDILFGINSKSFEGKTKIRLGGDIPGELGKKGFYCENGLIKSVNTAGETMYMLRPDGSGVMAKGNISWDADGNGSIFNKSIYWDKDGFHFGSRIKLTWDNLPADAKETLKGDKGDSGESAVRLDLTNENASVTCDATGKVVGIISPSVARIFKGGVVDGGWTFSGVVDGCRATVGSVTGLVSVIELLADNASVTVQANKNGYTRLEAVYNLSKVYPGADGEPAVIYSVRPSVDVLVKGKDGVVTPASISCEKLKQIGNSAPYVTNEKTLKYQLSNGSLVSYTGTVNIGNASWIEFTLYDGSTVLDRERVPVIADGQDGNPGDDANLLPWIEEWNSPDNKTEIGGEYVISPKMFSGTKGSDGKLTGVAFGRGVVTIDGVQKTGVFGIKDGDVTFSIDAETGSAMFKGNIYTPPFHITDDNLYDVTKITTGGQIPLYKVLFDKTGLNIQFDVTPYTPVLMELPRELKYKGAEANILCGTISSDPKYTSISVKHMSINSNTTPGIYQRINVSVRSLECYKFKCIVAEAPSNYPYDLVEGKVVEWILIK